jgi:hypothetical protein
MLLVFSLYSQAAEESSTPKYKDYSKYGKENNVNYWGEGVTPIPRTAYNEEEPGNRILEKFKKSAICSLLDPVFFVPAAAALLLTPDNWDEEISDWAVNHGIFSSDIEAAKHTSDLLLYALAAESLATGIAATSGERYWSRGSWTNKAKVLLVEGAAGYLAYKINDSVKKEVGRRRPDWKDHKSFPSGHSSGAFSAATISNNNIDGIKWLGNKPRTRYALQAFNIAAASTTAWARVEGEKHHIVDVLAGAAIGRFFTTFIQNIWLKQYEERASVNVSVQKDAAAISFSWSR